MKDATQFHIRPARPDEAGLFSAQHPEENKRLGAVGCVRMDFGRSGNEFWHTWWPRGPEELNSPAFKAELQQIVGKLREDVLKSRFAMERFCYNHGGKIDGGYVQNYGYIVETEHYRYCLRCPPSPGDYNGYLAVYDLAVQRQNMARDKPLVGRVSYANGDAQEFTDAEAFLKCVREELPYRPTTGFRYEVLTDDPTVRKAVDDIVFDLYGEENDRTVTLILPAAEAELLDAQEQLGAEGWEGVTVIDYDGIIPYAADFTDLPMELEEFNAFTKAARDIPRFEVPKLKALLEQFEVQDIETALFLTEHLADYVLTPDLSSPQETAIDHLRFMTDDHSAELLLSHVNLYAYGCDLIKEDNATLSPYGLLHRADCQPMLSPMQETQKMKMKMK